MSIAFGNFNLIVDRSLVSVSFIIHDGILHNLIYWSYKCFIFTNNRASVVVYVCWCSRYHESDWAHKLFRRLLVVLFYWYVSLTHARLKYINDISMLLYGYHLGCARHLHTMESFFWVGFTVCCGSRPLRVSRESHRKGELAGPMSAPRGWKAVTFERKLSS